MNTQQHLRNLEQATELVEAIQSLQNAQKYLRETLRVTNGNFPWLIERYEHQIEIKDMAIARLEQRYTKLLTITINSVSITTL
jgi:hypothetical protein